MIDELLDRTNALHRHVQQLAVELRGLRKERDALKQELETAQRKLDQVYLSNRSLQSQLDSGTLAHALIPKEDNAVLRQRLNKLIKELDTVIHFIEKS